MSSMTQKKTFQFHGFHKIHLNPILRGVLEFSKAFNKNGYHPPRAKPEGCLNCHYCEILCPEFAIFSTEAVAEKAIV